MSLRIKCYEIEKFADLCDTVNSNIAALKEEISYYSDGQHNDDFYKNSIQQLNDRIAAYENVIKKLEKMALS